MFYIVGRLVNEIRELWDQGPRDYCSQLWSPSNAEEIQQSEEIQKSFTRKIKSNSIEDYC